MAGPGIPHRQVAEVTTLVDVPGTLARLTGVKPLLPQDGGDLFSQRADRAVLIQAGDSGREWRWRGVYTSRYTYVDYGEGVVELFDRNDDPHETTNRAEDHELLPVRRDLAEVLRRLAGCAGSACQDTY
jgi:arylsulfatase A-like enzyme